VETGEVGAAGGGDVAMLMEGQAIQSRAGGERRVGTEGKMGNSKNYLT
jgi:hypothetical protein